MSEHEEKTCNCHEHNHNCEHHEHHEHHHDNHAEHHSHEHESNTISCSCGHCHEHGEAEHEEEMSLQKILISLAIFAVTLVASKLSIVKAMQTNSSYMLFDINIISLVIMFAFFVSYLIVGLPVIKSAVWNILHGEVFDEQFLMAIASIGAIILGEYAEAVAVMLFYQIGEYFQDYAVDKSKDSITQLMKLRPDSATVIRNGKEEAVDPDQVSIGETILVKPGERIPLDGIICKGTSFVDTSAQTGESVPREVLMGNEVLAGFVNLQGVLEITVQKSYGDSSVSRILKLVEHATQNKAKSERFITKFARVYTPAVCIAAALLAFLPPLITRTSFSPWIGRALIFLVVSCPCALVISIPLSFFGGIGSSSRCGILIKGSNYLEALAKVRTAVFDKTGTLTKGTFVVSAIHPASKLKLSQDELVAIATHAEYFSTHPISKSLKSAHHCALCGNVELKDTQEISGQGLCVTIKDQKILVGNLKLMQNQNVQGYLPCQKDDYGTIVHVAIDGEYAGHIVISDEVKEDSAEAISSLKKVGVKETCMLTGDIKNVAERTAQALGIDKVYSELLPEGKVQQLEAILKANKNKNESVMYIGDGINDAPVLARADVGVAMGALGSDAAIEAADVVIMSGEISKLSQAIKIAKRTVGIVNQNIVFALAIKFGIMIFGALGYANMWVAVFGDVGVAFLAVLNALRLLRVKSK